MLVITARSLDRICCGTMAKSGSKEWKIQIQRHLDYRCKSTTLASQICTLFLLNYNEIFANDTDSIGVLAHGRVLYDYSGEDVVLKEDQIVLLQELRTLFDGWWRGYIQYNSKWWFWTKVSSNYVEVEAQLADKEIISIIERINNK